MKTPVLVLLLACLLGAGCAVGPDFHRPAAPDDRSYTAQPTTSTATADSKAQQFVEGGNVAGKWWEVMHSPPLDEIVDTAVRDNPGLESARATLRRSQDSLRAGYGVFFPQLDGKVGASRQLYNAAPGALPSSTFNLFSLSGTVSYGLDIWGGERRQVEGQRAGVDAQRYTVAATYVILTSNVIDAIIAQAAYRDEIDVTKATVALLGEQVRIAKAQVVAGTSPYANVLTLQSQMASTEATLAPLEEKIDQAADLLAALTGKTPATWKQPIIALSDLQLPEELPLSVPSRLVRQRPDVLIAEAELHAANASIGVATAAMLPNVTLSAGYGTGNTVLGGLFDPASAAWNVGAGLTQPIFHGGSLYYQRKAAIDARDESAADYRQTVLGAFQQVADTLRGLGHDADALVAQKEAVDAAERAMGLLQANYQAGIATYLQMLVADIQYLQAKLGYVQVVAQRLQDTVALCVALGGGWWNVPASEG